MIVVDTSIWVSALRSAQSAEARILRRLLDADEVALPVAVRYEIMAGAARKDLPALRRTLSALPVIYPTDDTWQLIDGWIDRAATAGERFGLGDVLIGALAAENGALIWSLDADFTRMQRIGLVQLFDIEP
jgi:predicted nucleic acid-binding protein